jgi:Arc/MetJ family transcription regulator
MHTLQIQRYRYATETGISALTYTLSPVKRCITNPGGGDEMRTNIVIDEELMKKGIRYTGLRTKKELVNYALQELIQRKERKEILRLKGKLHWEGDLEELRRSRFDDPD